MNSVRTLLKTIWADMVERRLWPIAAALLVALVAAPIALSAGGGSSSNDVPLAQATPGSPISATGPTASTTPPVSLLTASQRHAANGKRDPFKLPGASTTSTTAAPPASTAPVPTPTPSPAPSSPTPSGGTTGGGSTPATPAAPKPKPDPRRYRVDLRVGQSGDLHTHDNVERLSPLPSTEDPFMVFMGVMSDGKTAVFLLSSDVTATGSGVCHPSATNCQTVEMKAEDIEFFDVKDDSTTDGATTTDTAPPLQYELDVDKIVKDSSATTDATSARAARAQTHAAHVGASVVNHAAAHGDDDTLSSYSYSPSTGTLTRVLPSLSDALGQIADAAGSGAPSSSSVAVSP